MIRTDSQSRFAVCLFVSYAAVVLAALGLGQALMRLFGPPAITSGLRFPPAFIWSTGLLILGSVLLRRAVQQVQLERQRPFRRALLGALGVGTLFVASQSYGLWYLARAADARAGEETGVHGFAFAFAVLHAMHFSVALMFLVFVTLKSQNDRYDHEYYWGVTVCEWFWHGLGAVWAAILVVFTFAVMG